MGSASSLITFAVVFSKSLNIQGVPENRDPDENCFFSRKISFDRKGLLIISTEIVLGAESSRGNNCNSEIKNTMS